MIKLVVDVYVNTAETIKKEDMDLAYGLNECVTYPYVFRRIDGNGVHLDSVTNRLHGTVLCNGIEYITTLTPDELDKKIDEVIDEDAFLMSTEN